MSRREERRGDEDKQERGGGVKRKRESPESQQLSYLWEVFLYFRLPEKTNTGMVRYQFNLTL